MAHTTGPVIGIIGIGGESSVGCNLSTALALTSRAFGIEGLLLNNGNAKPGEPPHTHIKAHIRGHLQDYLRGNLQKNTRYADTENIAREADITFICYEKSGGARHGMTFWEKEPTKKLYAANKDTARELGRIFSGKRSQIIMITNPSFALAYLFTNEGTFEPGQVLAFNPENERLQDTLRTLQEDLGTDVLTNDHLERSCVLGDHGTHAHLFMPPVKGAGHWIPVPETIKKQVKTTALDYILRFGNTAKNIVPQLISFIEQSRFAKPHITYFGMACPELNGAFCTVPVRSGRSNGTYRATRQDYPVSLTKELHCNPEFSTACDAIQTEQERLRANGDKIERSYALVLDADKGDIHAHGYHGKLERKIILGQPLAIRAAGNLFAVECQHGITGGTYDSWTQLSDKNYLTSFIEKGVYILTRVDGQTRIHCGNHGTIPVDKNTVRFVVDGRTIYCVNNQGTVTKLHDGTVTELATTGIQNPTDLFIAHTHRETYLGVLGDRLELRLNGTKASLPATGGAAIGIERETKLPVAFSTDGTIIDSYRLSSTGFERTHRADLGHPLVDIAFDPIDNYIYAITNTHLSIIPYWNGRFLCDKKKHTELGKQLEQVEVLRTCQTMMQNS